VTEWRRWLDRERWAIGTALRRVPKQLLGERIGALAPARAWEVKRALGFALDSAELKLVAR
jgi:hypothetical protein